jgi:serine/threonine protein kinase
MSAPTSIPELLDAAQRSGLISSDESRQLTKELAHSGGTQQEIAVQLVERNKLTSYQADLLLSGKGEECVLAKRYRLLEPLGAGNMGAVFKALDTTLDRPVAIKVMAPQHVNNPDAVARFHREAKALAKVSHPGIVQAYDAGEDHGRHFLVMEFVAGVNLSQTLKERGRITPPVAADLVYQAALGMEHAHERGLVHRDLKPGNLLLTPKGQIKILDLGLARFVQDQLGDGQITREGAGLGTPDYMAPEQFGDARHVDHRADIYALGCTLYHLLTGAVPFPGSSLTEKAAAHETAEPLAIETLAPDVPAGLILTVQRMMAKRPGERFQSAAEVAEALAVHVAGSSASLPEIRATTSWRGSQLSFVLDRRQTQIQPRRKRWLLPGAIAAVLVLIVAGVIFLPDWLAPGQTQDSNGTAGTPAPPAPVHEPNVLTVSKDANDGGQFRAINEALGKVQPGQTIRVLDNATYTEHVQLRVASQFEGLTLEAPKGAILQLPSTAENGCVLVFVSRVTLRGFGIRTTGPRQFCVGIGGATPGVRLEDLQLICRHAPTIGVTVENMSVPVGGEPVVIENCTVIGGDPGIQLLGVRVPSGQAWPNRGIIIRKNDLRDASAGIGLKGRLNDVHVVGNQVWNCGLSAVKMEELLDGSGHLLVANNTLKGTGQCLQIGDLPKGLERIEIRNNLILSEGSCDIAFAGNERGALDSLRIDHNWRQVRPPATGSADSKIWVEAKEDHIQDMIDLLSTDPKDPNFLRPAKDSPLATEGAGRTDPRLPSYVGAVPPEGVAPWDWDRTWRMPKEAQLLTVSKEEKDGGQYRTINDALKAAKPWATIRVLDGGVYPERLVLEEPERHAGITLQAVRHATIGLTDKSSAALLIKGVPHVRVEGFRFRHGLDSVAGRAFLAVTSGATGTVLERLDLQAEREVYGIVLQLAGMPGDGSVTQVRNCVVDVSGDGISVIGRAPAATGSVPGGVAVVDSRVYGALRGILVRGVMTRVHICGNVVHNAKYTALQVEDPGKQSSDLLFANNSVYESNQLFRLWQNEKDLEIPPRQVELCNNLFFEAVQGDVQAFVGDKTGMGYTSEDLVKSAFKSWRIHGNWRDLSGRASHENLPLAPGDRQAQRFSFLSRDSKHPDFLRPAADSPLATGGAGKDDPSLPLYVGAVPPKGVPAWDWDKTWRWRMRKSHRGDVERAEKKAETK